jgi:hypothetical protein
LQPGDAKRFQFFEKNWALALGLPKAVGDALTIGMEQIWNRVNYPETKYHTN